MVGFSSEVIDNRMVVLTIKAGAVCHIICGKGLNLAHIICGIHPRHSRGFKGAFSSVPRALETPFQVGFSALVPLVSVQI